MQRARQGLAGPIQFDALLEVSSEQLALISAEGQILYVSPAGSRLLGYATAEFVGKRILDLIHPDDSGRVQALMAAIMARPGNSAEGEFRLRDANGTWRNLAGIGTNHLETPGVRAVVARFHEVRPADAGEFEMLEDQFRLLIENALHVTAVLDIDYTVRYVSPAIHRMLGYAPRDLQHVHWFDLIHPDDRERVKARFQIGHTPPAGQFVEFRMQHRDGSWRILEAIATNRLQEPKIAGIVVDARDVTERNWSAELLQHSLEALLEIHAVGRQLGSNLEREAIADALLDGARRVAGIQGGVVLWLAPSHRLRVLRSQGATSFRLSDRERSAVLAVRRRVLATGILQTLHLSDSESVSIGRTAVVLPLRLDERVLGILEVYGSGLDQSTYDTLNILADQAASALERARLYADLAERERRLADMVRRLLIAQDEERRRIAYDIHDGLAQLATAAQQHVEAFAARYRGRSPLMRRELEQAVALTSRSVVEARRLIAGLRPTVLDDLGLSAAVAVELQTLRSEGWEVVLNDQLRDERFGPAIESALFRVVQESLSNVRKHAGVKRVQVTLQRLARGIRVEVIDSGRGFRPSVVLAARGPGERVGLAGIQERMALLAGRCSIRSRPGGGTRVRVEVGLQAPTDTED